MAIPAAPTITQVWPVEDPAPASTVVANLSSVGADTYEYVTGPATMFVDVDTIRTQDDNAEDLNGAFYIEVTATNVDGTSPPTGVTLVFADNENPYDDEDDDHNDNPQIPPTLPPDAAPDAAWSMFIVNATNRLFPLARDGVDFMVARDVRNSAPANIYWDDTVLGPRPDAEIEALARRLATESPVPFPS